MLFYARHLSRFTASCHRLLVRRGGRRLWACPSPFSCKGKAMQSSLAHIGELRLYVSPVLALYPSPVPVCIPGQVSLTPWLSSALSTFLFVCKASQLGHGGMEGRRVSQLTSWQVCTELFPFLCQDLISSFNEKQWKPSFRIISYFSSISIRFQFKYEAIVLDCD